MAFGARAHARTQGRKKNLNLFLAGHLRSKLTKQSRTPIPYHLVAAQWAALLIFSNIDIFTYNIYRNKYIYISFVSGCIPTQKFCAVHWAAEVTKCQPDSALSSFFIAAAHWSLVSHAAQRAAPKTMLNRKDGMPHHDLWLKCFMIGCTFQ